jgi:hypothetical protein
MKPYSGHQKGVQHRVIGNNMVPIEFLRPSGVYSSFLLFAKRSADKYNLSSRDILIELGRRYTVGGQEDMIEDLALDMAKAKGVA